MVMQGVVLQESISTGAGWTQPEICIQSSSPPNGSLREYRTSVVCSCFVISMGIHVRKTFLCTGTALKTIPNTKSASSLICQRSKLKYLVIQTAHLLSKEPRKALGESSVGKNLEFKTHSLSKPASAALISENMQTCISTRTICKKQGTISAKPLWNTTRLKTHS